MDLPTLSRHATHAVFGFALIVFPVLFFVVAPYGRHARAGWGPSLPAKLGWVLMESPSFFLFLLFWWLNPARFDPLVATLAAAWALHYGQRSFIYTARMKPSGHRKPVLTVALAVGFNLLNALGNATQLAPRPMDAAFFVGLALFLAGFAANIHADTVLRDLRADGSTGYAIPQRGLHRFVAAPNYLAEIVEWIGFAIAAQTLAGWAFVVFTFANLAPRAWAHRAWYRRTFPDYPATRRALVPYVW